MCEPIHVWNSLEMSKLIVSALTPILILVLTLIVNARTKRLDQQWREADRIAEKRVDLYDEIGVKANRIFAYIWYVGSWKETSPREILDLKRELDTAMYTYRPWFSEHFFRRYGDFVRAAFAEYHEPGSDAKIRTTLRDREGRYPQQWDREWDNLFLNEYERGRIRSAYDNLLAAIADELRLPGAIQRGHFRESA